MNKKIANIVFYQYAENGIKNKKACIFYNDGTVSDVSFDEGIDGGMISPIMTSYINAEYTFIINGDCSKLGWDTSKRFHDIRMKWCEKHKHDAESIVVINFGEDGPCYIVYDNNEEDKK